MQIEKGNIERKSMIQTPTQVKQPNDNKGVELLEQLREYKELQRMIEELESKASEIKNVIVSEMEAKQTEEIQIDIFKVRYKTVVSNRFDTKEFKQDNNELYSQYLKESSCKRFTIAL